MPRAFDRRQLTITHDPTRRITEELPKTPPFTGPTQMLPNGKDLPTPIVQQIIDSIVQGFTAWFNQTGFDTTALTDFSNTVAQALGTLGTIGLRLTKLENNGALILEDFATYPDGPDMGREWIQTYSGTGGATVGITAKYATVSLTLDTLARTCFVLHKTPSPDHRQKVSITCSTPQDVFGQSENLIITRWDNGDYVFAGLTWTQVRLGFVKAGTTTVLITRPLLFKNASSYTLDVTEDRVFRLFQDTDEILTATDSGAVSTLGKLTGFGAFCPNGAARPGVVGSFANYVP